MLRRYAVRGSMGVLFSVWISFFMAPAAFATSDESNDPQFLPLVLRSEAQAVELANTLVERWERRDSQSKEVELLHIEGMKLSPYLESALVVLRQRGYTVRGTFVSKASLEKSATQSGAEVLHYDAESYRDQRRVLSRLFGTPEGITFLNHFRKFSPNAAMKQIAFQTALLGGITAAAMRMLLPWWTEAPQPNYAELTVTTTVLASWIYYVMYQRREWSSLRNQGGSIVLKPNAPAGEQIQVCPNSHLFMAECLAQEHVLSALLASSLYYFGALGNPQGWEWAALVAKFSAASTSSAASYVPFEEVMAIELQRIEALQAEAPAEAAKKTRRLGLMTQFFYNVLYPVASNSGRFFTGVWSGVPLVALGTGAWFWKRAQLPHNETPDALGSAHGCAAVIRLRD